jgi:hypothetical protein
MYRRFDSTWNPPAGRSRYSWRSSPVERRSERRDQRRLVKPSTLEGSMSLTVFHPQFKAEAVHGKANSVNKYLLAIL